MLSNSQYIAFLSRIPLHVLVIFALVPLISYGQQDYAQKEKEYEKNYVKHLSANYDSALYWCNRSIQLLETKINSPERLSFRYGDKSAVLRSQGKLDAALLFGRKSLALAKKNPESDMAMSLHSISTVYKVKGQHDSSLYYAFQELGVLQTKKKDQRIALQLIVSSYSDMQDHKNALKYSKKIINESEKNEQLNRRDSMYLVSAYNTLGSTYRALNKPDIAIKYFRLAYNLNVAMKRYRGIITQAYNLAVTYMDKTPSYNLDSIQYYTNELFRVSHEVKDSYGILLSRSVKGIQCLESGQFDSAIFHLTQAEIHMKRQKQFLRAGDVYKYLGIAYANRNIDSSVYYISLYDSLVHRNFDESKAQAIEGLEVRYETEQIRRDNINLQDEIALKERVSRMRIFLFIVIILLLLLIAQVSILYFKRKRRIAEINMLRSEHALLRTQMNPHFIFNSLSTIGNYVLSNQKEDGYLYISKFSKLIRTILDSSRQEFVTLQQEIDLIENFLWLHKKRLKDKLNYSLEIDPLISPEDIDIPPMLMQPFIENAIIHGIEASESAGTIRIVIASHTKGVIMRIADTGPGFSQKDDQKKKEYSSHALKITQERIENIQKSTKRKVELSILDTQNDTRGVTVSLLFVHRK